MTQKDRILADINQESREWASGQLAKAKRNMWRVVGWCSLAAFALGLLAGLRLG